MSTVKFLIIVDTINKEITFKDNGTDISSLDGLPSSLTIYMRGEDKTKYVVKKEILTNTDITSFFNDGIVYTYEELFGLSLPLDNFYYTEVIINESLETQMLADIVSVGFTYTIADLVFNNIIGVNIPVNDLFESLTVGMMPQSLELLNVLSTAANYSYDRENKWRKIYNHLNIVVNDITY